MPLDEIDHLLLTLVQADAARPLHDLGDAVGLSPSAVQRRLTRLRATNVIRAEVAVLDPDVLGAGMTSVVLIALTHDDEKHHTAFRERMLAEPRVQHCYSIVGQWDYVVVLLSPDLKASRRLSRKLFDQYVNRFETLPAFEVVKSSQSVPVPGVSRGSGR
ncbi:Lrp/AsnC family transcriptional regulator [Amycolatopsis sp. QT-25]|uniref:Lrp/AsnC family transcriptional regulator n=1 Tax=Amycolatopsis sp. QT-25 TaxID=3034022 RepID=UPI0023ED6FFE|nr:Lrp/AsnC family transcriptional regulator [Amycolatopsis sp. QT-25]WET77826.1 Lrp/AsnC family transcriptional regulator [Amycolatopsis sp. QT-25]